MSERIVSEERPIDTNISTAALAGMETRSRAEESKDRKVAETGDARNGMETRNAKDWNAADRPVNTASKTTALPNPNATEESTTPLFPSGEATDLRARWDAIQVGFVDEPRQAVEQADALVAAAMKRLAEIFAKERAGLEGQWDRGDNVSTEDLRLALRRYRSFFGRVLSV